MRLEQALGDYERTTTNQLVVVTLASLQGTSIEDYGYQLGRAWGIGQKGKDNGVLFIIVPSEHKVRIEVGYGLEPTLTDAMSSNIIQTVVLPDFRSGTMEKGIIDGTAAILGVLKGDAPSTALSVRQGVPQARPTYRKSASDDMPVFIVIVLCVVFIISRACSSRHYGGPWVGGGGWIGPGGSGGGLGGGFSGGGGSFGGGGASGGW
jgi:uncharacterized protein